MTARGVRVAMYRVATALVLVSCVKVRVVTDGTSQEAAAVEAVRAAQSARFRAMMNADVASLDTLLANDLTYVHTGGQLQTKPGFIGSIRAKTLVYESIAPSDVSIRTYDGTAVGTGLSNMRVRTDAGVSSFGIRFTETYVWRDGRWQLVAWQAARSQ